MFSRCRPGGLIAAALCLACCPPAIGRDSAGPLAERPAWRWERKLEFARALATRQYHDIGNLVIARLDADKTIIGIERAFLSQRTGEYYADAAGELAAQHKLQGFLDCLDQARTRHRRYLDYPAIQTGPRYAAERFETRMTLCRLTLAMAEGVARLRDDKRTPDADRPKLTQRATKLHQSAIADFDRAVADKSSHVERIRRIEPKGDEALRREWRRQLRGVREEFFRVRLERNMARVRFATFLKKAKAPTKDWQAQLDAAENDYRKLLLEFSGTPGATQANLELARCLLEKGPKHDGEAIERLTEVWRKRGDFPRYSRIPCEAAELKAAILLRQKKPAEAIAAIDALLAVASDGAWDPEQRTAGLVAALVGELPEEDREQFSRRAGVRVLLLQAEAFALQGAQARQAGRPRAEIRRAFGAACDIATGVLRAQRFVAPRYTPLINGWLKEAGQLAPPELLWQRYVGALDRGDYREAAHLLQQIAAQQTTLPRERLSPADKRELWFSMGRCYHAAGMGREAAYAFLAAARWFPDVTAPGSNPVSAAVGAAAAQHQRTHSNLDKRFLEWVQEQAELLVPGTGAAPVRKGIRLRRNGRLRQAIEAFQQVKPDQEAHPHALYHTAVTWKLTFAGLSPADQKGAEGRQVLQQMEQAFAALYGFCKARYPELQRKGDNDACRGLIEAVSAALAMHTDFYTRKPCNDPDRVLKLTSDLAKRFPGIEKSSAFALILFNRMRAACALAPESPMGRVEELLIAIEEGWRTIQADGGFPHRDKAAAIGAHAHLAVAGRLEKKDTARAQRHRDRGLDFYLQLIDVAPDQPVETYHYILLRLKTRPHKPKSEDYRAIVAIAPAAIERFKGKPNAARALLDIRIALGVAFHGLGKHREAIRVLEGIDDQLEGPYRQRLREYRRQLDEWQRQQQRRQRPEGPPGRDPGHAEVKENLAFCYIASSRRDRYERALEAYVFLCRVYDRKPDKYAVIVYSLCETLHRLGRYEDAARRIDRVLYRPAAFYGGRAGRARLRRLVARMKTATAKLSDPRRRTELEPFLDELLARLRQ